MRLQTLVITGLLVSAPAAANASIESLLIEEGVTEDSAPRVLSDSDRPLTKLIRRRAAHTPTVEYAIERLFELAPPTVPRDWPGRLEHDETLAELAPRISHGGKNPSGLKFDIPLADHPLVDSWIDYFTTRGRGWFEKVLARAERYKPIMQPILAERGLPLDTIYLAMIESGFSSRAYSIAAASGFWQFIPSTGRLYGLRNDTWVDERRDFEMSTHSAARYLRDLHRQFGDWHLAWAGYNAGGGRISRALSRYSVEDFWTLTDNRRSLAKETQHYVPKIIAAALVAKDRERYGFTSVQPLSALSWDKIEVESATDLRIIARRLGVAIDELRTLNPALRHDITPPGRKYFIRVPDGRGAEVAEWLEDLPASKRLTYRQHRVQSGETLIGIAARHGTQMTVVKEFNRIRNPHLLQPGQLLIIPALAGTKASPRKTTRVAKKTSSKPKARHRVSRGDTLWAVAQRYGVSVQSLKKWNRRRSNNIRVGEILHIF